MGLKELLIRCDNSSVVHITNAMVSASRGMMSELRRLKCILDHMGLHISAEWIPSVANRFADALSRRFSRGDLQVRGRLRRSTMDGMAAPVDAFKYRPLGEHQVFQRKLVFQELASTWEADKLRLLCPPPDLLGPVFRKLRQTRVPAMLLMPDWSRQPWHRAALDLASTVRRMPIPPTEVWTATRRLNPAWKLLLLKVNMDKGL